MLFLVLVSLQFKQNFPIVLVLFIASEIVANVGLFKDKNLLLGNNYPKKEDYQIAKMSFLENILQISLEMYIENLFVEYKNEKNVKK